MLRWEPVELVREALKDRLADDGAGAPSADSLARVLFGGFAIGGFWEDFDRGVIGLDEVAAEMAASSGLPASDVRQVLDAVPGHLALRPDTLAVVEEVRAAGHRVVYLSNMPGPYADDLDGILDPIFSGGVFSCRVGEVKPEPEIFDIAVRELGIDPALDPDRVLFLDDRQPNVDAARDLGWPAALFTDPASCRAALAAGGWLDA